MNSTIGWLTRLARIVAAAAALNIFLAMSLASAATVTLNGSALNSIFSQASFGANPIDIRYLSTQTLVAPDLLDISSTDHTELEQLVPATFGPVINMAFIDSFDGSPGSGVIGQGWLDAAGVAVDSTIAAGVKGAALLAHEIIHNLGLGHVGDSANLMFSGLTGATLLTVAQVADIMTSGLLQTDISGYYLEIQPILVTAVSAVPLPAGGLLLLSGIFGLALLKRRLQP